MQDCHPPLHFIDSACSLPNVEIFPIALPFWFPLIFNPCNPQVFLPGGDDADVQSLPACAAGRTNLRIDSIKV